MSVIDFHSHILPGIDDGSPSVEQSIAMLLAEAAQGIRHVVATPHFYAQHHKPESFLQKRREAEAMLRREMEKYPDLPRLSIGAEVLYFSGISDSAALAELTVDGSEYILVEMPMPPWSERVYKELRDISRKQGLIPIIAHVDRYIAPFRTHGIPKRLAELPVLIQANGEFFLERATKNMALRMMRQGRIHLLGSDCHNLTDRAPNLRQALDVIEGKFGPDIIRYIHDFEDEVFPNG
ncbi:MAG: capsular polysaccharide biosynthesis protein [Oscillospiraceae bacterium]|nr:capsular polysaccharide biosynthesis protein [Oscillospiraceae bacterium]